MASVILVNVDAIPDGRGRVAINYPVIPVAKNMGSAETARACVHKDGTDATAPYVSNFATLTTLANFSNFVSISSYNASFFLGGLLF